MTQLRATSLMREVNGRESEGKSAITSTAPTTKTPGLTDVCFGTPTPSRYFPSNQTPGISGALKGHRR